MTTAQGDPTAPLLVLNPRASRLRDPASRAAHRRGGDARRPRAHRARPTRRRRHAGRRGRGARSADRRAAGRRDRWRWDGPPHRRHPDGSVDPDGDRPGRDRERPRRTALGSAVSGPRSRPSGRACPGRSTSGWPSGAGRARLGRTVRACSWWPPVWGSTHGSWMPPTRSGSNGCGSGRTSARCSARSPDWRRPTSPIMADGDRFERHGHLVLVANAGQIIPGRLGPREPIDPGDGRLDLLVVGGGGMASGLRSAAELLLRTGDLDGTAVRREGPRGPDRERAAPAGRDRWRRPCPGLARRPHRAGRGDAARRPGASAHLTDQLANAPVAGRQMCCNPVSRPRAPEEDPWASAPLRGR